jgi:hypothetical protein
MQALPGSRSICAFFAFIIAAHVNAEPSLFVIPSAPHMASLPSERLKGCALPPATSDHQRLSRHVSRRGGPTALGKSYVVV